MSSSTVTAQRLANEANIQNTRETNQANIEMSNATNALNKQIADEQNALNYQMFNEQNDWNLAQWERENEYNSPKLQVQRYMEAGINPLWAMSKGDAGNAQHLTSAAAHPAAGATMVAPSSVAPQVMPEFDPSRLSNIVSAATNVSNTLQGFYKLGLESIDTDTRRNVANSQIGVNTAEALFKKSQTTGQDIFNNLNTDTYGVLVGIKQREYDKLISDIDNAKKQGQLTDALIDNAKETKNQIIAQTDYTQKQAKVIIQQVWQGWRKLAIDQQNADTNAKNAETNAFTAASDSYYKGENLKLAGKQFNLEVDKFQKQYKQETNEMLIKFYSEKRGYLGRMLGNLDPTDQLTHLGSQPTTEKAIERSFAEIMAIGNELYNRQVKNPSAANLKSYQEFLDGLSELPVAPYAIFPNANFNTSNTSVINPSPDWGN